MTFRPKVVFRIEKKIIFVFREMRISIWRTIYTGALVRPNDLTRMLRRATVPRVTLDMLSIIIASACQSRIDDTRHSNAPG